MLRTVLRWLRRGMGMVVVVVVEEVVEEEEGK
jgi:hypothetical protein